MQQVTDVDALREQTARWRRQGEAIGFVPTMGNLHAGHLSLVEQSRARCARNIVSIFVNPFQFGPSEDLERYPRTPAQDIRALEQAGVDLVFLPDLHTVYPRPLDETTRVVVPGLGDILEGEHRPGFFVGVATVVLKLFNLVQPNVAVFGEKDFQQLVVIRRMVRELDLPVAVAGGPIVRESDGLAMSSRNAYLSAEERRRAPELFRALQALGASLRQGEQAPGRLEKQGRERLESAGFQVDYLTVRRADDLRSPAPADTRLVILAAAWLGSTRLIDNVQVDLPPAA
jgi:pantoate--beta-alanine ligase